MQWQQHHTPETYHQAAPRVTQPHLDLVRVRVWVRVRASVFVLELVLEQELELELELELEQGLVLEQEQAVSYLTALRVIQPGLCLKLGLEESS